MRQRKDLIHLNYIWLERTRINGFTERRNEFFDNIIVVGAADVISMDDFPTDTFKSKPNSSMNVAMDLVKDKKVDGVISAGNTGAFTANSILKLGRIPGVGRPTIGALFPTERGSTMVFVM